MSWLRGIPAKGGQAPLTPLPLRQDKNKICSYNRKVSDYRRKKKSIHHITAYIWLRLLYKSLHPYFAPLPACRQAGAPQNIRYTETLSKMSLRSILYNSEKLITSNLMNNFEQRPGKKEFSSYSEQAEEIALLEF